MAVVVTAVVVVVVAVVVLGGVYGVTLMLNCSDVEVTTSPLSTATTYA